MKVLSTRNPLPSSLLVLLVLHSISGCCFQTRRDIIATPAFIDLGRVAVIGFQPALPDGSTPGPIRSPVTGTVFMANPTTQYIADKLTLSLFSKLVDAKCYDLIPPGQAKGVLESTRRTNAGIGEIERAQKVGRALSAQTVLMGYTYRWEDREGTDYAVNQPASVAFDLYLLQVENAAILWKGKYDKTQRSLSENLLDMDTFLKGKGKWMTADRLAEIGLNTILQGFPKGIRFRES